MHWYFINKIVKLLKILYMEWLTSWFIIFHAFVRTHYQKSRSWVVWNTLVFLVKLLLCLWQLTLQVLLFYSSFFLFQCSADLILLLCSLKSILESDWCINGCLLDLLSNSNLQAWAISKSEEALAPLRI